MLILHVNCRFRAELEVHSPRQLGQTIYTFLVRNGIDSSRLQYVGFGGSKPFFKALSLEDQKKTEGLK